MTFRLSAKYVNGAPPTDFAVILNGYQNVKGYIGTSTVSRTKEFTEMSTFKCPADDTQNRRCLSCTMCWDKLPNIPYKKK